MKRLATLLPLVLAFGLGNARATTIVGDLNNFDTLNDTGQVCYGFEIEIDGIHSTDITYTFDWNHYGAPKIREDNTDPSMPKVFVRYESTKNSSGAWGANGSFTNTAIPTITPPQGHTCTDTSVNEGCEHFGVGYYGTPASIKYNWLVDGGGGTLAYFGTPVSIATPTFTYTPPAPGVAAQAVAVIPAPVVPNAGGKQFGEPSWVKVIKTTTHNSNPVALQDLVSDSDGANPRWQNGEPAEVESEWHLLQTNNGANPAKAELQGLPDDMGDGSETVTRRYEFYRYGAAADTFDGENGEAMCSEVNPTTNVNDPNYLHGVGESVVVTDANGDPYTVNCAAQVVVGTFIGAQMAGFAAAAPLGLIDHLQDGESGVAYTARTVVVGGNAPFVLTITGNLPPGLTLDPADGVLSGTPLGGGDFPFTVQATDGDNHTASQTYSLHIIGPPAPQFHVDVATQGSGKGTVTGNGINCGLSCSVVLDAGTSMSLTATPTPGSGSVFRGWSGGSCAGTGNCAFTLNADATVYAEFVQQWPLTVSTAGTGTGTVTGNGISCGATCSVQLDQDTPVLLTATPTNGSIFMGWSTNCAVTLAGECSTTLTAAQTVTATFVPPTQPYTLSVTLSLPDGTVTSSPRGISCGKRCSASFTVGTSVTLTAKPDKKHTFLGWTGACATSNTSPTCVVTMMGAQSVGATFD